MRRLAPTFLLALMLGGCALLLGSRDEDKCGWYHGYAIEYLRTKPDYGSLGPVYAFCGPYQVDPYHAAILNQPDAERIYTRLLDSERTTLAGQLEALSGLGLVNSSEMWRRAQPYLVRSDSVWHTTGDVMIQERVDSLTTQLVRWHLVERPKRTTNPAR